MKTLMVYEKVNKSNKIRAGSRLFDVLNHIFLALLALSCIVPILHVLAVSLSASSASQAGQVYLWPVDITLDSYAFIVRSGKFLTAMLVTLRRLAIGVTLNLFLVILTAYPLSKEESAFRGRTIYAWFLFFTVLFGGGLIPAYMTVRSYGLIDSLWALVLPGALPVFNVVLLLNFFRQLPAGVEDAALIDGAGHWTILWRIFVPMSLPSLATITLFACVGHWNAWFDGIIYMNKTTNYPLSSYLQVMINQSNAMTEIMRATPEMAELLKRINDKTLKSAQVFLGALPIIMVYPFLQRFFMKGIVIGSVKG